MRLVSCSLVVISPAITSTVDLGVVFWRNIVQADSGREYWSRIRALSEDPPGPGRLYLLSLHWRLGYFPPLTQAEWFTDSQSKTDETLSRDSHR